MNKEWEKADLDRLISDEVEESMSIEYKGAKALHKAKKFKIAKTVSAMANAAGGIIVYGMSEYGNEDEDEAKKHLPKELSPIDRTQFSREWLDQVINSNIHPRIEGLIIHPVDLGANKKDVAYVVQVPQSMTAHQVTTNQDYRYYERANFEVVRMPDHRIRDVMNRAVIPVVDVKFSEQKSLEGRFYEKLLKIEIFNLGNIVIRFMKLEFNFPDFNNIPAADAPNGTPAGEVNTEIVGTTCTIKREEYVYNITYYNNNVLFPKDVIDISNIINLKYRIGQTKNKKYLKWSLYADSMTPKHGRLPISAIA